MSTLGLDATRRTGAFRLILPRRVVVALLASLYGAAFILSPYWNLAPSGIVKTILLGVLIAFGAAWSYLSAGTAQVRLERSQLVSGAVLLAALFIINLRSLTSAIPWRGDESSHIARTQLLASKVPVLWFLLALISVSFLIFLAWRNWKWALVVGGIEVAGAALLLARSPAFQPAELSWILRYPLVNYWAYAVPVKLVAPAVGIYQELAYRLVPFLAMTSLAWVTQREISGVPRPLALAWGLAIGTIPIIFYYSSLLYVEPPVVLLMVLVCLRLKRLLETPANEVMTEPGWYALILIGFIRDTVLLFVVLILLLRWVYQARAYRERSVGEGRRRLLGNELRVAFCVCAPCILYIVLRGTLASHVRAYHPDVSVVGDPSIYRAIAQSLAEQFGLWALLFIAGVVMLWRKGRILQAIFLSLICAVYAVFFALDTQGMYAGYSRFNLLIAPAIITGSVIPIKEIGRLGRMPSLLAASVIIAANLLISPVHMDGSKVPLWGNYLYDTSDHYYPYRDALAWLKDTAGEDSILFTGLDFQYDFEFYFGQLDWHPRRTFQFVTYAPDPADDFQMAFYDSAWHPRRKIDALWASGAAPSEAQQVQRTLHSASGATFGYVVYQLLGNELPNVTEGSGFRLVKTFQNEAHTLLIYRRAP
jgi:hypothetical protein